MKKTVLIAMFGLMVGSVWANGETKEQFCEAKRAFAESKGWKHNQALAEQIFDEMDVNKDGFVTGDEKKAWNQLQREKKAAEGKG